MREFGEEDQKFLKFFEHFRLFHSFKRYMGTCFLNMWKKNVLMYFLINSYGLIHKKSL